MDIEREEAACDFCGSNRRELLFQGPDRLLGLPGTFRFVRCQDCGLLYQSPRLPWGQLAAYYEGDYASHGPVVQDEVNPLLRMIKRLGPLKQRHYVERFQKQGMLLDVGCGSGVFLAEMQVTGQWQLEGLEPTPVAAEYVRRRLGIAVTEEIFEEAHFAPGSQDVITMWHVLEHFGSPSQAINQAWKLLKPGGYLIFAIPSYESLGRRLFGRFWVGWDLPRHLFTFPRRVLMRQLGAHGFRVIDIRCFLISYAALGHSLTFWTQCWPQTLRPLGRLVVRAYYTPVTRLLLYPLQRVVEYLGLSSVTSWAVQKVDRDG